MNYYNEWDSFAAKWLKELITDGLIPDGKVDSRSIADVEPSDLKGFTQCHFFAGIGGWSRALQLAGGVQTDLFGQEVLPVSHSQQQESNQAKKTSDISGQCSLISSESANLQQSLVSKLQAQLDLDGLTIYKGTWKQKVTPQQRSYYQVVVSQPRTKGTGSSSWPTPTTHNAKENGYPGK